MCGHCSGTPYEHGTHTSLLAHGGRYAALVAAQLDGHNGTAPADRLPARNGATTVAASHPGNTQERR
jgi:hypothetical protein